MLTVSPIKPPLPLTLAGNQQIQPLDNEHRADVLSFLAARPLHTFIMTSWIPDNGLASSFNRARPSHKELSVRACSLGQGRENRSISQLLHARTNQAAPGLL